MAQEEVIKLWDLFGSDFLGLRVEGEVVLAVKIALKA